MCIILQNSSPPLVLKDWAYTFPLIKINLSHVQYFFPFLYFTWYFPHSQVNLDNSPTLMWLNSGGKELLTPLWFHYSF